MLQTRRLVPSPPLVSACPRVLQEPPFRPLLWCATNDTCHARNPLAVNPHSSWALSTPCSRHTGAACVHGLTGCRPARRLHGSSRRRLRLHHAAQPLPARRPARPERRLGERDLRHGTVRCVGPPPHSIACPARPSLAIPPPPVSSLSCLPLPCNLTASLVIALL